jgi:hypothetical protein
MPEGVGYPCTIFTRRWPCWPVKEKHFAKTLKKVFKKGF